MARPVPPADMARAACVAVMMCIVKCAPTDDLVACPGADDSHEDRKCNRDALHRLCARNASGRPVLGGLEGQSLGALGERPPRQEGGVHAARGSGCVSIWAAARLMTEQGCESISLHCNATDVPYTLQAYAASGEGLAGAGSCLRRHCRRGAVVLLSEEGGPALQRLGRGGRTASVGVSIAAFAAVVVAALAASIGTLSAIQLQERLQAGLALHRWVKWVKRNGSTESSESLTHSALASQRTFAPLR